MKNLVVLVRNRDGDNLSELMGKAKGKLEKGLPLSEDVQLKTTGNEIWVMIAKKQENEIKSIRTLCEQLIGNTGIVIENLQLEAPGQTKKKKMPAESAIHTITTDTVTQSEYSPLPAPLSTAS